MADVSFGTGACSESTQTVCRPLPLVTIITNTPFPKHRGQAPFALSAYKALSDYTVKDKPDLRNALKHCHSAAMWRHNNK